jgi:hypothetical protein
MIGGAFMLASCAVSFSQSKRVEVAFGLSQRERKKLLMAELALGACIAGGVSVACATDWMSGLLGGIMLLAGAVIAKKFYRPLHAVRYRDGEFWLKGASIAFLDSLDRTDREL